MERLEPPLGKMNHNNSGSTSSQESNGNSASCDVTTAFSSAASTRSSEDHSSELCVSGREASAPQFQQQTSSLTVPSTATMSRMPSTSALGGTSSATSTQTSSSVSSSLLGTATTSSTSPLSTRYPAKIHYKLQNRSSPTNLSSGCPTTNNSPSTSSVSSPVTSEQHSPLLSPSANSSNNGNCLYDINEEIDQAMQSSSAVIPAIRSCDSVTPTMETVEDIETDEPASSEQQDTQPRSRLESFPFSQSTEESTMADESEPGSSDSHNAPHYMKGSVIELGNKTLKRIEEITADDLMQFSGSNCLKFAKVDKIQMSNGVGVTQKPSIEITLISNSSSLTTTASIEQPFISKDDGWVSASPQITTQLYGLPCQPIKIGSQLLIGFTTSAQYGHVASGGAESAANGAPQHMSNSSGAGASSPTTANSFHTSAVGSHNGGAASSGLSSYKLESSVTSGARSAFTPLPSSPGRHSVARKRTLEFDSNNFGTSKSPNLQTPETKVS